MARHFLLLHSILFLFFSFTLRGVRGWVPHFRDWMIPLLLRRTAEEIVTVSVIVIGNLDFQMFIDGAR